MTQRTVSVFGGSAPKPQTPAYTEAYRLGRYLAEAGYIVMNGGYGGTMEATGKGAQEASGRVIGITVGLFEDRFKLKPNPYIDEVIRYDTLHERLHNLVTRPDAFIALTGGVGTLSEVALVWSLLQVGEAAPKPLVLVGPAWARVMATIQTELYIKETRDMALISHVSEVEAVVPALEAWFDDPPRLSRS